MIQLQASKTIGYSHGYGYGSGSCSCSGYGNGYGNGSGHHTPDKTQDFATLAIMASNQTLNLRLA